MHLRRGKSVLGLTRLYSLLLGGEQSREGWKAIEALSSVYEHWIPRENIIKTNTWSSELSKLVNTSFYYIGM